MTPELGLIEGYFGRPWPHEARKQVLTRLRALGYGFFHFAPKADAFLRRRWREPHPDAALAELADLSAHCRRLGLRFGVGLSPYELYRDFSGDARRAFVDKVRSLDAIGIDDLAILFDDTHGDLPDLVTARGQAERAAVALESANTEFNQARVAVGKAQSDHATASQELAAAQATVKDAQRALRIAAARQLLSDALVQEATALQRVETTAAELKSVNLALLRQDVDRFARSAQQLEEGHERRRQDIMRLEVDLETKGALGLEEQGAERQRELESATRRADELTRRAAALDHLLGLLREKRSALARRLRAPLQKHLDHYLGILFPGARIEVADDLSPGAITRIGPRGQESGGFEELSVGTREQMGIVARLAYADLLQEAGRPTLLILDDALVNTDDDRLGQMKRVLYDAAQRHQVLIFTCHPAAWRDLGVVARPVGA